MSNAPLELYVGLKYLMEKQRPALDRLGHYDTSPDTLARYGNALQIEVAEFVNELPWKVWKKKDPDLDRVVDEFADVLHFLGTFVSLLDLMGMTPETLATAFQTKWDENQRRFDGKVLHYGIPRPNNEWPSDFKDHNGDTQLHMALNTIEKIRDIGVSVEDVPAAWNPRPGEILRDPLADAEEEPSALDED